jgi:hypothetical protein
MGIEKPFALAYYARVPHLRQVFLLIPAGVIKG